MPAPVQSYRSSAPRRGASYPRLPQTSLHPAYHPPWQPATGQQHCRQATPASRQRAPSRGGLPMGHPLEPRVGQPRALGRRPVTCGVPLPSVWHKSYTTGFERSEKRPVTGAEVPQDQTLPCRLIPPAKLKSKT